MRSIKNFAIILGLVQLLCLVVVFVYKDKSFGTTFMLAQYGNAVFFWFMGLMFFTFLVWYRGHERTVKKDFSALVVLSCITFLSAMLAAVMFFDPFNR